MSVPRSGRSVRRRQPAYHLYRWAWAGLDWLYPPVCGGCGKRGKRWCFDCQQKTQLVSPVVCQVCGQPWGGQGICQDCRSSPPHFAALRSWAFFSGPIRQALHRLKYRGDIALGEVLARPLIQKLVELEWRVDLVTPVPMGVARQEQRGYNQSALLAWPLALGSGDRYLPTALLKIRETPSQVGLSMAQRKSNVTGAFQARQELVAGKRVLVVDDVTTSGATLEACALALKEAGASQVFGLTLARAL